MTAIYKGIGNLLEAFLGIPYWLAIVIVFVIVMAYTAVGGFISVVKNGRRSGGPHDWRRRCVVLGYGHGRRRPGVFLDGQRSSRGRWAILLELCRAFSHLAGSCSPSPSNSLWSRASSPAFTP
ncbi:MAG: sodium:solute symporter family transporter [Acidobacteriota bacterium]